ncbi:hypothetical protein M0R45_006723 [Rubus argutus]|uniref:RPA-interacting protein n=1 Tax=Rubus argutus TaxID=59490 RepID=A0AAW1YRR4_RUBAR
MEDEAAGAMKSTQTKRRLKPQPLFNNYHSWKYKLRENCYKRVREDRRRLLWKMRMLPTPQIVNHDPNDEFIKSAFQDIVSAEFEKLKDSSLNDNIGNDVLWEYDDLKTAYQGDCEDILLEMQTIFYEDLSREPTRKGAENRVETWEDEEDEYLAQAVYDHMQLNDKKLHKEEVWCPICNEVSLELLRVRLAEVHIVL